MFDPLSYRIGSQNNIKQLYSINKKEAEAYLFQKATFPIISVRFPCVIGENDHTNRIYFHIVSVENDIPINIKNINKKMSFIYVKDAGIFLGNIKNKNFQGPINIANKGCISIKEMLLIIERLLHKKANFSDQAETMSPYAHLSYRLDTKKAIQLGFKLQYIQPMLFNVIKYLINSNK